jgi:hypothetical protein
MMVVTVARLILFVIQVIGRVASVVLMIVTAAEQDRTNDVHAQPNHCDNDRLDVLDRLCRKQPLDRSPHHEHNHDQEKHCACKACQHLDFPGADANRLSPASRRAVAYAKALNPIATTCELM